MRIIVHSITPAQPSNANRDDLGMCKTCVLGGTVRVRYSPQSRGAAMRPLLAKRIADRRGESTRTTRLGDMVIEELRVLDPSLTDADAEKLADRAFTALTKSQARSDAEAKVATAETKLQKALAELAAAEESESTDDKALKDKRKAVERAESEVTKSTEAANKSGALWLVSPGQVNALAQYLLDTADAAPGKDFKSRCLDALNSSPSLDSAAFGRMVAASNELNIDAAVQLAHSVSVNEFTGDTDFFTAIDERKGVAAVMDYNYLSSPIMYSYAAVDVDLLASNLGVSVDSPWFKESLSILVELLATAMPRGRETKAGSISRPSGVYLTAGDGGGILTAGFLRTLDDDAEAFAKLLDTGRRYAAGYGDTFAAQSLWTIHDDVVDEGFSGVAHGSLSEAVEAVVSAAVGE